MLTSFMYADELDYLESREFSLARRIARSFVCSKRARLNISTKEALSS